MYIECVLSDRVCFLEGRVRGKMRAFKRSNHRFSHSSPGKCAHKVLDDRHEELKGISIVVEYDQHTFALVGDEPRPMRHQKVRCATTPSGSPADGYGRIHA